MTTANPWLTLGLLAAALVACGSDGAGPSTDSGSHWLLWCLADDECGDDLTCSCGICTPVCETETACEGLSELAVCVAPAALGADCSDEPVTPAGICAADCTAASDCPDTAFFVCDGGYCVAELPLPAVCQPADCEETSAVGEHDCADGSTAGPTGDCLRYDDGSCGWEVTTCADGLCAEAECGPPLGMPNVQCPDGVNFSGPTGRCLETAGGCGWEIAECPDEPDPPAECTDEECGPAMGAPNILCPDGVTVGGPSCERSADGDCGWILIDCPE